LQAEIDTPWRSRKTVQFGLGGVTPMDNWEMAL